MNPIKLKSARQWSEEWLRSGHTNEELILAVRAEALWAAAAIIPVKPGNAELIGLLNNEASKAAEESIWK
jgi:hypothetical protein